MALPAFQQGRTFRFFRERQMKDHRCRYCQQVFQASPYHPQQLVCSRPDCQRRRRHDYHRQKIASDPVYRQVCLESPRKWREAHPDYWKQYRQGHPQQVERNRRQQRVRDQRRRQANLANNNLASRNILSVRALTHPASKTPASCKQQPSGVAPAAGL